MFYNFPCTSLALLLIDLFLSIFFNATVNGVSFLISFCCCCCCQCGEVQLTFFIILTLHPVTLLNLFISSSSFCSWQEGRSLGFSTYMIMLSVNKEFYLFSSQIGAFIFIFILLPVQSLQYNVEYKWQKWTALACFLSQFPDQGSNTPLGSESSESKPLDHQEIPQIVYSWIIIF